MFFLPGGARSTSGSGKNSSTYRVLIPEGGENTSGCRKNNSTYRALTPEGRGKHVRTREEKLNLPCPDPGVERNTRQNPGRKAQPTVS